MARVGASLCLLAASLFAAPAAAETYYWNVATGQWEVAANWSPQQVPGSDDVAVIDNGGAALFDIGSGTPWSLLQLVVGQNATGTLDITGGTAVHAHEESGVIIGDGTGANSGTGIVTVSGTDSLNNASTLSATLGFFVGGYGTGTLNVKNGGSIVAGDSLYIGNEGDGTLNVEGATSTVLANAHIVRCPRKNGPV